MTADNVVKIIADAREVEEARPPKSKAAKPEEVPEVECLASVAPQPIRWLWPQRFALGKLSLIAGHPGLGKSQLALDIAARVTIGASWPCNGGTAPSGNVVILSAEDDAADTIRPRLDAAGGAAERVHILHAISEGEARRGFDLTRDMAHLENVARKTGDVKLVIIDPISAYMGQPGKIDTHRNTDVRAVLAPLQDFAARWGLAVIAISHLTKGGGSEALARVTGSGAFVAAARAAFLVGKEKDEEDEDTGRRLFVPAKNNLGDDRTGFAFRIVEKTATHPLRAPAVEWEDKPVFTSADEALASDKPSGKGPAAREFLRELLESGPMPAKQVEEAGAKRGLSPDQLKRAKERLGIRPQRHGFGKNSVWAWALPGDVRGKQEEMPI